MPKCINCNYNCDSISEYNSHLKSKLHKKHIALYCKICKYQCKNIYEYNKHLNTNNHLQKDHDLQLKCIKCKEIFKFKSLYIRHKNRKTSCIKSNNIQQSQNITDAQQEQTIDDDYDNMSDNEKKKIIRAYNKLKISKSQPVIINNNITNITNNIAKLENYTINPTEFKNPKFAYLNQMKNHTYSYMLSDDTIDIHNNSILEYFKNVNFAYKPINVFSKEDEYEEYEYYKNNLEQLEKTKELYAKYKTENLVRLVEYYTINLIKILRNEFVNTQKTISNYFFIYQYKLFYKNSLTTFTKLCKDVLDTLIAYNEEELFKIIKSHIIEYIDCLDLANFSVLKYDYEMLSKELYIIVENYINSDFSNLQSSKGNAMHTNINEIVLNNNYKYHLKGENY